MACFSACLAEALIMTGLKKTVEHHEKVNNKAPVLSKKIGVLIKMLLGGSFLLLIEHIFHGEIVPFYPFLTAVNSPEETEEMIEEILSVGVTMDIAITSVWAVYFFVFNTLFSKREEKA